MNAIQTTVRHFRHAAVRGSVGLIAAIALFGTARAATLDWVGVNIPWVGYGWGFGSSYNGSTQDTYLTEIKSTYHCNFIRIWLCEGLDGLSFNSSGACTGLSATNLSHIKDYVSRANAKGLTVDCVFINFLDVQNHPNYINSQSNYNALITNGFLPIAKGLNGSNVVFDLVNEGNLSTNKVSWSQLRAFLSAAVNAAHNNGVTKWMTMSDQNAGDYTGAFNSTVGGLGFDWFDYHSYDDNGSVNVSPSNVGGKPLMLGEYGPSSAWPNRSDTANQATIDAFMNNASSKGLKGTAAWSYLDDGSNFMLRGRNQMWNIEWWAAHFGH